MVLNKSSAWKKNNAHKNGKGKSSVNAQSFARHIKSGHQPRPKTPHSRSQNPPTRSARTRTTLSALGLHDTLRGGNDPDSDTDYSDASSDAVSEDWQEGKTLVEGLLDFEAENEDEELEKNLSLVEELRGPFMARAAELKQDLTDVLVPAMDRIRLVHDHLEQTTEVDYATGVVECDQACDELFATSMTDLEELRVAMEESQNNLKHLFSQLKQEYEQRDHLWDEFIDDFNTLNQNARESLNGLSTSVEATISTVDKKCKSLVAEKKKGGLEMDKIKAMIAATS